ncbi:hypothetical protein [Bordetella bronchiseptica]|uniref:hypothetical protein n=1 Tax=Bordetella bronchiseptica TaxID=518 RepID=UPI00045B92A0|nr:hypothetical protein [Bordetella bronchiseptica]KAK75859.1 hypothetical protein L530_2639 [Bordetella bronchiseptica MO211]KCV26166.1 hypothetical protein L489_2907 [Bordetella bronchiseptica 00-P-2730]
MWTLLRNRLLTLLLGFWLAAPAQAFDAFECDCAQQVGTCSATVRILKTGGSAPSYSAELLVQSSAPVCSRVSYLIDQTPYTTVLTRRNQDTESTSGTSPIKAANVKVQGCALCARKSAFAPNEPGAAPDDGGAAQAFSAGLAPGGFDPASKQAGFDAAVSTGRARDAAFNSIVTGLGAAAAITSAAAQAQQAGAAPTPGQRAAPSNSSRSSQYDLRNAGPQGGGKCMDPAAPGCPYHLGTYDPVGAPK